MRKIVYDVEYPIICKIHSELFFNSLRISVYQSMNSHIYVGVPCVWWFFLRLIEKIFEMTQISLEWSIAIYQLIRLKHAKPTGQTDQLPVCVYPLFFLAKSFYWIWWFDDWMHATGAMQFATVHQVKKSAIYFNELDLSRIHLTICWFWFFFVCFFFVCSLVLTFKCNFLALFYCAVPHNQLI